MDINATLAERHKTHGTFSENASAYSDLMRASNVNFVFKYPNDPVGDDIKDCDTARVGLIYILLKISRIVTGNWREVDHWRDIAGYATLVARRLAREPEYSDAKETDQT